ncbi:acetyltransferase [Loigolactobacillus bifermentans DSM 20003]|uniref:Acetyltransferase n=2 Tax=Loigolactobacillus bifermentans TaxID=1607 RepID=A0A0R1H247_9LACO|nr:GNAT family N-acetyltransferase [Loigolactobacillus bifermentans]KRK36711.1 acetyltransferase [Loigolactobacillus bifermentans DSM 20003]QGG60571.1 GNAT family N-acetyltransferase [Loigolactobacillus bifermentans]
MKEGVAQMPLRLIEPRDNTALRQVIQSTLREYHDDLPGTAYYDPQLGQLAAFYQQTPYARYWVVEQQGQIVGGGGIAPFPQSGVAELQKLYLLPNARGQGYATQLMQHCITTAREFGYHTLYLETFKNLHTAIKMYEKYQFQPLTAALSGTAHSTCDAWYSLAL